MEIHKKIVHIQKYLDNLRQEGRSIGFVPTMGALHNGHTSLVKEAKKNKDICVVSIFVNPTQFNDKTDFGNYPKNFETDIEVLKSLGVDVLFLPDDTEMYPDGAIEDHEWDFGDITTRLEGKFRPGHFNGVIQVVRKLLNIILPDNLYMGQKDYQQILVVKKLIENMGVQVALIICPTIREVDGLAMSSRNSLLNKKDREEAANIHKVLLAVKERAPSQSKEALETYAIDQLNRIDCIDSIEYFEIVDPTSLLPSKTLLGSESAIACVAVKIGDTRLIDNVFIS